MSRKQTDNYALAEKLRVRRWGLNAVGFPELRVWDLCAGTGRIWSQLRSEYSVAAYTPCDIQPRMPGTITLNINEERYLRAFDVSRFNVLDIDPYGEPWTCWLHLAPRIAGPTVVFLTYVPVGPRGGGARPSKKLWGLAGLPESWYPVADHTLTVYLAEYALRKSAEQCIIEKACMVKTNHARYYAMVVDKLA